MQKMIKVNLLGFLVIFLFSGLALGVDVKIDGVDTEFFHKCTITINGDLVNGSHNGFPLMFDSTVNAELQAHLKHKDEDPPGKVQDINGYDIVFATADGADILMHEIEKYVPSTGEYIAWVKVDLTGSDQDIYIYYKSTEVSGDTQHIEDVWDSNYVLVMHFNEVSGLHQDSTQYHNHATEQSVSQQGQDWNQINGSTRFNMDNENDITIGGQSESLDITDAITIEAWIRNLGGLDGSHRIVVKTYEKYCLRVRNADHFEGYIDQDGYPFESTWDGGPAVADIEGHLVLTWDGSGPDNYMHLYWNGNYYDDSDDEYPGTIIDDDGDPDVVYIGSHGSGEYFDGCIDEVRLSNIARTAEWIETEYNNIHQPENFFDVGPTLVDLSYFRAKPLDSAVLLEWATETELDNEGFNLLRRDGEDEEYTRINPYFIPARGTAGLGAEYSYTDFDVKNGVTYYYLLEDIDSFGNSTFHGPVSATPNDIILIWPIDWQILPSGSSLFSWISSGNFSYKIDISAGPSFSDSETMSFPEEGWVSGPSLWLRPDEWEMVIRKAQQSGGHLFWRVRAKGEDGRVICSEGQRFAIDNHRIPEE